MKLLNLAALSAACGLLLGGCVPEHVMGENWAGPSSSPGDREFTSRAAVEDHVEGHAVIACRQLAEGRISGCRLTYEAPLGYGFGAAALRMSEEMVIRSHAVPIGEQTVVPVNFCPKADMPACQHWKPVVETDAEGRQRLAMPPAIP
jgi:hypothetical protein